MVKGGGHSYFGNSNRAGSLLVWTHRLRGIELHDAFRPDGAPADAPAVPAVSLGAGTLWGEGRALSTALMFTPPEVLARVDEAVRTATA